MQNQSDINTLLKLFSEGHYAEAAPLAEAMTVNFPFQGTGWMILGAVLKQMGQNTDAHTAMQKAAELMPDDAGVQSNLGIILRELGRLDEAEASYRQALKIKPDFAEAHNNLGITLKELGRLGEAEASYRQALQIKPDFAEAHNNLGINFKELGRLNEAEASLHQALQIKPDYPNAHNNLGITLKELGRLDEAEASYRQAIKAQPNFAEAHNNLGLTLNALGRLGEAEVSYRRAIQSQPNFVAAHSNLGLNLKEMGRLDEAEVCCRKALTINPDFAEGHSNLGSILYNQCRLGEAEISCRHALEIKPDYAEAQNNLGNILSGAGNIVEAVSCYRKAISNRPSWAIPYFNLHALLLNPADMSASIKCLGKAVEFDPSNDNYRFFLGMLLDYSGNREAAAVLFGQIEKSTNKSRSLLDAWRYFKSATKKLPIMTGSNTQAFKVGIDAAATDGLVMEFGVRFGATICQIASLVDQEIHGFDSFEGLPEQWHDEPKGTYSTKGVIPEVSDNVTLYAGWFEDTLPEFLKSHPGPVRFMNIDCDIYSSTKTVIDLLADRIIPGSVIVFDEYIGNEHWREDEFKAFQESVTKYQWSYEYLCFSFFTKQVVVRIVQV